MLKIESEWYIKHTCSVIIVDTWSSDKRIQWTSGYETGERRGNGCRIIRERGDGEFFSLMLTFKLLFQLSFKDSIHLSLN